MKSQTRSTIFPSRPGAFFLLLQIIITEQKRYKYTDLNVKYNVFRFGVFFHFSAVDLGERFLFCKLKDVT